METIIKIKNPRVCYLSITLFFMFNNRDEKSVHIYNEILKIKSVHHWAITVKTTLPYQIRGIAVCCCLF